ncbi:MULTISPECIES: HypC/HybG/HupF family hydrogenase formation chaperone [Anoxybacillus]|jgi:hydrogenase expression/formation protein HypC|uniref:(NiFe) hydrogenase metallocenter assembly protein HypC n=3 Tax=Anoxybacillus TaxID=150247 RepID=A0A178T625_9BACL|nr:MULTISPECIES: HypC/HybG/HupF family hydrogenase formation chaperone [Anoxybacillus]ELK21936.1 hydrogenase assembly chaperone HypC/HupF [Anoxybacillus flavithermus TNO-09.006]EMT45943.1 hydrogenase assembly chaperone HypC/HupF [Anoxybacillus flavithermus AK1]MBE2908240.1 HypC/HybG/HupF family hydrogenase formation chaperone [Anoxybacillus flavithermus]MBE2910964.1 HypC/HybG/HupF family hydrogenase formation chaperone [Anoxybacillus flavithermus]MBE2917169.1 HypC/HybG/HupF family hydrogenase 
MCVGVPAKVLHIEGFSALVDVMGSQMNVGIIFVPEVKIGDYVIVHAGQAMSIIDEQYAQESLEEWRKLVDARSDGSLNT